MIARMDGDFSFWLLYIFSGYKEKPRFLYRDAAGSAKRIKSIHKITP
jgi:hypothetical protein